VRLTAAAEAAWMIAAGEAAASGYTRIEPAHLLVGVLSLGKLGSKADSGRLGVDATLVKRENQRLLEALVPLKLDTLRLRRRARTRLGRGPASGPPAGPLSRSLAGKAIFAAAATFAGEDEPIGVAHLLAALAEGVDAITADLVRGMRIDPAALRAAALTAAAPPPPEALESGGGTPRLDRYGRDLTALARRGELPPVFGRRREILAVLQALARGARNNPVLVGEPGVGRAAVVEAIATRAAEGKDPAVLAGRRIVALDSAALAALAEGPGGAEERLREIVAEARAHPEVLVFVDAFHTVSSVLGPAVERGELRLIAATTHEDFRRLVEESPGIESRLERVTVEEPDREEALEILRGLRPMLEKQHDIGLADEALEAAVDLSTRFEVDRRLPDKAIDLLEVAASSARSAFPATGASLAEDVEAADGEAPVLGAGDVAAALAARRGLPAELVRYELAGGVGARLSSLESVLRERLVGQDAAVARIAKRLRQAFAEPPQSPGPMAVVLFLGPSGVGKTEAARVVAEHLFGSAWGMIRVDVSELADEQGVARLLGSPGGGLSGLEDEGVLTGAIRAKPRALLLLEEIQKAHPRVLDVFLHLLEQGRLTDARGRSADARKLVVVMTSCQAEQALRRQYRPELLGRVDEIVAFRALDEEDVSLATGRVLAELVEAVERRHGVRLRVTPEAARFVTAQAVAAGPGASAARITAEKLVQGPLSALVVAGKLTRHPSWTAVYDEGGVYLLPER
jgi:ATP-dependent Clp protease ATP-binding subunit ClpC